MNATLVTKSVRLLLGILAFAPAMAAAQPHDVAWTFGADGFSAYRLDAFAPAGIQFAPLGSENPTLPLELGQRYQVTVTNHFSHPFEIIAKAASAAQDNVLLSMAIVGPFESHPGVAWEDNGRGVVRFTLTLELYQALSEGGRKPGYRCRPHSATMRGEFTVAGLPLAHRIAPAPLRIGLQPVAAGLTAPVALVPDPGHSARLYVVDQAGPLRVIENGQLLGKPFLDVTGLLVPLRANYDERGFLGLAFHPDYAQPGQAGHRRFYTYTSEPVQGPADFTVELPAGTTMNHQSAVREWLWDGVSDSIDPTSSRVLLRIDQPQSNHNAGHLEFGPDGYLYIALGDGGGANDTAAGHGTQGNGQNINTILGTIVRIDPLHPTLTPGSPDPVSANGAYRVPWDNPFVGVEGLDEIFAYGLRNPYRFSFDARSGALIVPDVGQNRVEEINLVHKGRNYGWRLKEGTFAFDPAGVLVGLPLDDPRLTDPVAQYDHDDGLAVVAGYTYYGREVPELWGQYLCGDFSRQFSVPEGRLFAADLFTGRIEELLIGPRGEPLGLFVKGFGQDREGEVYLLASTALGPTGNTGVVLKLVAAPTDFAARLTGAPAGTDIAATGEAVFTLSPNGEILSYRLSVQGLENVTMAHIHIASAPGTDGPPAVWLFPPAPPAVTLPGPFSGLLGEGNITTARFVGPLAGRTLADLLTAIRENRAYVNVHTQQFPAGAIRGPVEATRAELPIAAVLTGAGDKTTSPATGLAVLTPAPDGNAIAYQLKVQGITNVTMAHIHVAATPGGDGPPAVWLYPAAPPAVTIPGEFTGVLSEGVFTAAHLVGPLAGKTLADLLTAIREDRAYVNVHTLQFPAGEIRGGLK
ncbi:MAG: CHRD domain-containing protein [Planctomycetes bacterium]|nr:CHRD domain-containing protein [Planctomycetota bacterium]